MQVTVLGSGTSTGIPLIGCPCHVCTSSDPRDKRLRASVLIEHDGKKVLIDTSADFRQQMLTYNVKMLDAILYTHHHYDHIAGFDDLRAFQFLYRKSPPCYASKTTSDHIERVFSYAFGAALQKGGGLPEVTFHDLGLKETAVAGLNVMPVPLMHGTLPILGFRIGAFAYLTDCSTIPKESYPLLRGVSTLILDGLRYKAHPTHLSIEQAVAEAKKIGAAKTYLTHMNHDVLHEEAERELPENVRLAYDGLILEV